MIIETVSVCFTEAVQSGLFAEMIIETVSVCFTEAVQGGLDSCLIGVSVIC